MRKRISSIWRRVRVESSHIDFNLEKQPSVNFSPSIILLSSLYHPNLTKLKFKQLRPVPLSNRRQLPSLISTYHHAILTYLQIPEHRHGNSGQNLERHNIVITQSQVGEFRKANVLNIDQNLSSFVIIYLKYQLLRYSSVISQSRIVLTRAKCLSSPHFCRSSLRPTDLLSLPFLFLIGFW